MDIIKTGIGLTKTIKNVSRLREIVSVFAQHGFDEIIIKSNLHQKIPGFVLPQKRIKEAIDSYESDDLWYGVGFRLRRAFEQLGPSFIKLGQLLATREDIFHAAFISEMKKLQNAVKNNSENASISIIESSLGKKWSEVFLSIEEKAIATASIGSVYKAILKNGDVVVIKVRKPGIEKLIDTDFEILQWMLIQVEKVSDELKYLGLSRMMNDFHRAIRLELNFTLEANNLERLKANIETIDKDKILKIPKCYREYSSDKILVMEFLDGIAFNQLTKDQINPVVTKNLLTCVQMFMHTLLSDGFFHADLHGGNFFLLENNQIGLIDFGSVGTLSKKNRSSLVGILYSMVNYNFDNLILEFIDVAEYDKIPNIQQLVRSTEEVLSPYIGLSVNQLNFSDLMKTTIGNMAKHQIYLPREWSIIFRAITTLDGVGRSLGLDINVFNFMEEGVEKIIPKLISKDAMTEDMMWMAKDFLQSARIIPKHLSWSLKQWSAQNYAIEIKHEGVSKGLMKVEQGLQFLGICIISSVFLISGVWLLGEQKVINDLRQIPHLTFIFWMIAAVILFFGFWRSFLQNKKD